MGFAQAIKKGITGVQSAYNQQKAAAESRAKRRMEAARTQLERERIKAELEREKLILQRQMYEAKLAVNQEREAVARARTAARGPSPLAGLSKGLASGYRALEKFYDRGAPPPKRKPATRKATARKPAARKTTRR